MPKNKEDIFDPIRTVKLFNYDEVFNNFIQLYKNNKYPKVLLLSGEKGLGKFTLAFHLINFFLSSKDSKDPYDIKHFTINRNNIFYWDFLIWTNIYYLA